MTLKTSYFKLLKADAKNRLYVPALSCIVFILSIVIYALAAQSYSSVSDQSLVNGIYEGMLLNYDNPFLSMIAVIGGVICGTDGFSYLFSKSSVDFYHGLPIKRNRLFFIRWINGVLFYVIPWFLFSVVSVLIASAFGGDVKQFAVSAVSAFFINIIIFLLAYHTDIIAVMLTGNCLVSVAAFLALSLYAYAILNMIPIFIHVYYSTYQEVSLGFCEIFYNLSIFYLIAQLIACSSFGLILFGVIYSIFLLGIGLWLYKKRPSEAASNPLAFPKTASALRILIAVPTALYMGLFISDLSSGGRVFWAIFGMLLILIMMHAAMETILNFDIHCAFHHKKQLAICAVFGILFMAFFSADLLHMDQKIPDIGSVEAVYLDLPIDNDIYYQNLKDGDTIDTTAYREDHVRLEGEDLEYVYSLLSYCLPSSYALGADSENYYNLNIRFVKNNGVSSYRSFVLLPEEAKDALANVYDHTAYKEGACQIFDAQAQKTVNSFVLYDLSEEQIASRSFANEEEKADLIKIYTDEYSKLTYAQLTQENNEVPIGELRFKNETNFVDISCDIYPSFTKTIAWLNEHNCDIHAWETYTPVSMEIFIMNSSASDQDNVTDAEPDDDFYERVKLLSDPDEIRTYYGDLYSNSYSSRNALNAYYNSDADYYVTLTLMDDTGETHTYSLRLKKDGKNMTS